MKITYIAPFSPGCTGRMRGECLLRNFPSAEFTVIDTAVPLQDTSRLWRSIGWRFQVGPMISGLNEYIRRRIPAKTQELIWVDKAVFLTPELTRLLRDRAKLLVHYTPDMAFCANRSALFYRSAHYYDYLITTKTCEANDYRRLVDAGKTQIIMTTQGFQAQLHRPVVPFERKKGVVFIGLHEPSRELVLDRLLAGGVPLLLAGVGWESFVRRHRLPHLDYRGRSLFGDSYVEAVSGGMFAWGALSKRFPERHTTRTFEISACGTALITERNEEISVFFGEKEAIFYSSVGEMIEKIFYYQAHPDELRQLTVRGNAAVHARALDYDSIISGLLRSMGVEKC